MNTESNVKPIGFDEDTFDLSAHKKAADAVTKRKSRFKRIRRQVVVGKVILAIIAVLIFFLIYYLAVSTNFVNFA